MQPHFAFIYVPRIMLLSPYETLSLSYTLLMSSLPDVSP